MSTLIADGNGEDKNEKCLIILKGKMFFPRSSTECLIDRDLQSYIDCRKFYSYNVDNGLNYEGKNILGDDTISLNLYNKFNDSINKVLYEDLKKVKNKSLEIMCEKDTLHEFQKILKTQDHCYSDRFISVFGSEEDISKAFIKINYFNDVYKWTNAHLESKEKPKKKIELCDSYLKCLATYVHANHVDVSIEVKNLYKKTLKKCAPNYYTLKTTVERKEVNRKERRGNSMVPGPRNFITTNIIETKSNQIMYIDAKKGRLVLLPAKDKDSSRANLQSYKFDSKACQYDLLTDTQLDKHITHRQASILRHNIGLVNDDNANIVFKIRNSQSLGDILINWKELENNGHITKSGTHKNETERLASISFGRDYDKKQDKVASIVLHNIPLDKKGRCRARAVHDGLIGKGNSQSDISFKYEIEINQASMDDVNKFRSSNVSDRWEHRAKIKKPSQFEKEPDGILDSIEGQTYNDLFESEKKKWDNTVDSQKEKEEYKSTTIDDLEMFTK